MPAPPQTKRVPFFPQLEERDCGATCLRMVAAAYGVDVSMDRLRELTRTTDQGTTLAGVAAGAEALGFESLSAELPYTALVDGDVLPAILHWDRDHFVIATAADYEGVSVLDPAVGATQFTRADFEAFRYGPGRSRAGIVIRPTSEPPADTAQEPPGDAVDAGERGVPARPRMLIGAVALFGACLAVSYWLLAGVLEQGVDLQFREGLLRHLAALTFATIASNAVAYLIRRTSSGYAGALAVRELDTIQAHARTKSADPRVVVDPDYYLRLLSDSDDMRVWRAYRLADVCICGLLTGLSIATLFFVDVWWALLTVVLTVASVVLAKYTRRLRRTNESAATEHQRERRRAMYEYTRTLPRVVGFGSTEVLDARLANRNDLAERSFRAVAAEYGAVNQLGHFADALHAVLLLCFGLFRLGYGGLELGAFLLGTVAVGIAVYALPPAVTALLKWEDLKPARLRLHDIDAAAVPPAGLTSGAVAEVPEFVRLVWRDSGGEQVGVRFPTRARVAFVGPDRPTRAALVAALLGRDNDRGARLLVEDDVDVGDPPRGPLPDPASGAGVAPLRSVRDFGTYGVIGPHDTVPAGTLAETIARSEDPDPAALGAAAAVAGIVGEEPPRGVQTVAGFNGEGVDEDLAVRALIARAVYADAAALLLDNATSSLPAYQEGLILDRLLDWGHDRLLVVSADRVNAAVGCDFVVHIEDGEVIAAGTHAQLMALHGPYFHQITQSNIT